MPRLPQLSANVDVGNGQRKPRRVGVVDRVLPEDARGPIAVLIHPVEVRERLLRLFELPDSMRPA